MSTKITVAPNFTFSLTFRTFGHTEAPHETHKI